MLKGVVKLKEHWRGRDALVVVERVGLTGVGRCTNILYRFSLNNFVRSITI